MDLRIGIGIGPAYWYWVNLVLDTLLMYLLAGWTRVTAEMICQDRWFGSSIKRIICNCCELDNVNSHCNRNAASIFAKHPLGELGGALRCRKLDSNVTIQLSLLSSEKMRALYFG